MSVARTHAHLVQMVDHVLVGRRKVTVDAQHSELAWCRVGVVLLAIATRRLGKEPRVEVHVLRSVVHAARQAAKEA